MVNSSELKQCVKTQVGLFFTDFGELERLPPTTVAKFEETNVNIKLDCSDPNRD